MDILDEVETGVLGLRARFWTDHAGDYWLRFVQMACQRDGSQQYDYASVPILVNDYINAPTHWIMANGNGGNCDKSFIILVSFIGFRRVSF